MGNINVFANILNEDKTLSISVDEMCKKIIAAANAIRQAEKNKAEFIIVGLRQAHIIHIDGVLRKNRLKGKLKFASWQLNNVFGNGKNKGKRLHRRRAHK